MNNWCVFYVASYKGGELMMRKNISEEEVVDIITNECCFLCDYLDETKNTTISDEDLLKLWEDWYSEEEQHYLYAYDYRSEIQVYQIKDNKLVESFPSKECILNCLKSYIESWKEWKKNKLILTRGIQGSGKTTWARQWVEEDPENRVRINNDDIRNMLGKYWVLSRESLVSNIKEDLVKNAMNRGYDIVVDNMNLNPKEILFWKRIVDENNKDVDSYKYEIEYKDFFISLEECIRRDAMRSNPIGEKVIRETWKRYKHFIQTTEVEKYVNNLRKYTGKPKCIVIDMDSTMCFNTTKRPWFGDGAAEGMINDVPNTGMCDMIRKLQEDFVIVVATGRDTTQEAVTKEWLAKQGINVDEYYFRTNKDYRKGVVVKKEQIEAILEKYDIVAIFDDCEPIVDMYREMGLTVLQPNKGL